MAHRLVWRALRGPIPDGLELNHLNGDKSDNRLQNLEIVTASQNMRHAIKAGLQRQIGEMSSLAKLSAARVLELRRQYELGIPDRILAERYGISRGHVWKIANRQKWGSV